MVESKKDKGVFKLKDQPRVTKGTIKNHTKTVCVDGLQISSSEITRLEKRLKHFKEQVSFFSVMLTGDTVRRAADQVADQTRPGQRPRQKEE